MPRNGTGDPLRNSSKYYFCPNYSFSSLLTIPLTILVPSSLRPLFGGVYRPQGEQFGRGSGVGGGGVGAGGGVGGGGSQQPVATAIICEWTIG